MRRTTATDLSDDETVRADVRDRVHLQDYWELVLRIHGLLWTPEES